MTTAPGKRQRPKWKCRSSHIRRAEWKRRSKPRHSPGTDTPLQPAECTRWRWPRPHGDGPQRRRVRIPRTWSGRAHGGPPRAVGHRPATISGAGSVARMPLRRRARSQPRHLPGRYGRMQMSANLRTHLEGPVRPAKTGDGGPVNGYWTGGSGIGARWAVLQRLGGPNPGPFPRGRPTRAARVPPSRGWPALPPPGACDHYCCIILLRCYTNHA